MDVGKALVVSQGPLLKKIFTKLSHFLSVEFAIFMARGMYVRIK
jgi:hypothetical protein